MRGVHLGPIDNKNSVESSGRTGGSQGEATTKTTVGSQPSKARTLEANPDNRQMRFRMGKRN